MKNIYLASLCAFLLLSCASKKEEPAPVVTEEESDSSIVKEGSNSANAIENRDTRKNQSVLLVKSVSRGDFTEVEAFLKDGFDPNSKDKEDRYAIIISAENGFTDIFKLLATYGAKIDVRSPEKLTPLEIAERHNNQDLVQVIREYMFLQFVKQRDIDKALTLVSEKVNLNATDTLGRGAMHYAIMSGDSQIASSLFDEGLDLNVKDNDGITPLMLASGLGDSKMVNFLLLKNADKTARDVNGKLAVDYAREKGFKDIVEVLSM